MSDSSINFQPPWWLRHPHVQTCYPQVFRFKSKVPQYIERFELSDQDFIELSHTQADSDHLVILLHGLEGSANAPYIQLFIEALHQAGFDTLTMQFRSCGSEVNRLSRFYHAADSADLAELMAHLLQKYPGKTLSAIGFSLGGSVLLHYMARFNTLYRAIAISAPYSLQACVEQLPKFYDLYFTRSMNQKLKAKAALGIRPYMQCKTIKEFDHQVTAPDFGFASAEDYYQAASPIAILKEITTPTLLVSALDDPFVPAETLPQAHQLNNHIQTMWLAHGGHSGFISKGKPWKPQHALIQPSIDFLR